MAYLEQLFDVNYLEYASYTIKERAIPNIEDGLKPVQRRIVHTLIEQDDGKFHKVANIVGQCMKYHPHGDASIYEALVVLANKDLFIDKQGNFGNIYTGDVASAARYIECRLLPLAKEVLYNPEITEYVESYDGRNKEPVTFPAKIPVLLALGSEGIAVGMTTKILPHNLNELLEAQISYLKKKPFELYPDFLTGGKVDVSEYEDGNGKVTVRAKIDTSDPKKIVITEIPYSTTTESLIASIEDAARKNKLKVGGISDFTAEKVEIEIRLPRGVHTDEVVDALFAFTDCEVSISINMTVIKENKPIITNCKDVIKHNTDRLVEILTKELKLEEKALRDRLHAKTLEQIFIENRIYKKIENQKTRDGVVKAVHDGLKPFQSQIRRTVTDEDVETLLKIPIRRISLYDINKAKEEMREIKNRLKEIKEALSNMKKTSITYLQGLIEKFGKDHPRKTEISAIEKIDVRQAARRDLKLKYDKKSGYLGYGINGDSLLDVSAYDRVLVIRKNGTFQVIDAPEKLFVDKGMLFCDFIDKDREYCIIYKDKKKGFPHIKRLQFEKFILNKTYEIVPEGSSHVKLSTGKKSEIEVTYKPKPRMKIKSEKFKIDDYPIRNPKAGGMRLSNRECIGMSFSN